MMFMTIEESLIRIKKAMKIGEYGFAENLLKKIIARKSSYSLPFMLLGNVYEQTGKIKKALHYYKKALRLRPNNVEIYNNIGVAYKNLKEFEKALAFFNRALLLEPRRADVYYNMGNVYKEIGDYETAIIQYEQSIRINPGFVPAYNNLGTVLELLERYEEAGKVYSAGLEVDDNNPRLHYNLGVLYEKLDKLEEAKNEFQFALKNKPGWNDALLNLGIVQSKLSEHTKSINTFQNLLKNDPGNVKAVNNLGIEYSKLKNVEMAKSYYKKALVINPDYDKAQLNLSTLLEEQGDLHNALETMKNLVEKRPHDISARFRLATIYAAIGNYKEAEIQFRHILLKIPNHSDALRALGNLYIRTGNYDEANKCYNRLTLTDPDMTEYHLDFAVLLNDQKEFAKSEFEVKKFLASNPDDINALSLLGELYYKQGYINKAAHLFESIIEKKPNIVKPYYYLAKIYKKTGALDKAVEIIEKLITLQGTRQTMADMENLGNAIKMYEAATEEYEKKFKVELNNKIALLDDFSFDAGNNKTEENGFDLLFTEEDDDTIMKTGGKEPLIPVKEEVSQIKIVEVEKKDEPVVEIKDKEPLPLTDLLRNQDLYDNLLTIKQKEQPATFNIQPRDQQKEIDTEKENITSEEPIIESKNGKDVASEKNDEKLRDDDYTSNDNKDVIEAEKTNENVELQEEQETKIEEDIQEKQEAGNQTELSGLSQGMVNSITDKLDTLIDKQDTTQKKKRDLADETLLKVLHNISEALHEQKHAGPFPAFYLPPQKKQRVSKKKKNNDKLITDFPVKKKTTRERLKDFFGNIRRKLTEKKELTLPEDTEKQEYIHKLFTKVKDKPFEKKTHQHKKKKNEPRHSSKVIIVSEPENLYTEKDLKTNEIHDKVDEIDTFFVREPVIPEENDFDNEFVLEEEIIPHTEIQNQDNEEKYDYEHTILVREKKKREQKSFVPRIRPQKKRPSGSLVVQTLQFFRKIIQSIPGIGMNTGIKSKLDNVLKKLINK